MKKNRKAFTLIELLAVIIILAIVALIATPLILNVIDDAEKSANRSQVELLLGGAEQIYTQSYLNDEYKALLTDSNIYGNELFQFSGELPGVGVVKIKNNGEIFLAVEIDDMCYTKDYTQDKISETKVVEGEDCVPLTVTISPSNPNVTNWYASDINATIQTNGTSLKYCTVHNVDATISLENCTPDTQVDNIEHNLTISETGKTKICALPIKGENESTEISCAEYKIDKTVPTITAKTEEFTIEQGENVDLTTYFDTTYGPSNGSIVCNPASTSDLTVDNNTLTCKAVGNNGLESTEVSKEVTVYPACDDSVVNVVYGEGMIPISIDNDGTVKIADTASEWYNYCDSIWANSVILKDEETYNNYKSANSGTIIPMDDIFQMYVYIPRYKYKIFYTNDSNYSVEIVFETKDTQKSYSPMVDNWLTHPAFSVTSEGEIDGLWVGKFEQGIDNEIKPNVNSMYSKNVESLFNETASVNNLNGLTENVDIHMIKNLEWGAITYLSQSIYGICESRTLCGNKVENNNYGSSSGNITTTGCGGIDDVIREVCPLENRWNTEIGVKASTTHNLYGIYDMAGGKWEYMMSNVLDSVNGAYYFETANSGFDTAPHKKYYDIYPNGTSTEKYSNRLLGDATWETFPSNKKTWNNDYAYMAIEISPWFIRGGNATHSAASGIFSFWSSAGAASSSTTTRSTLWVLE